MRLAATLEGKEIPPYEILKMATVNGALAMGLNDSTTLEVGKYADIIMVDIVNKTDNILYDLVHNTTANNVKLTMINGKVLYKNGQYFYKESKEDIYKKVEEISMRIEKDL